MLVEELDIIDKSFELNDLHSSAEGRIFVPIMDEYPDPENTFDLMQNADGEGYSNQDGGFQVSGEDVAGAVEGVGAIVQAFKKTGLKKTIKDTCGRRPLSKKKRESQGWNACEAKVKAIASGDFVSPQQQQQEQRQQQRQQQQFDTPPSGMSTGAKVGIGIGIVAVLGIVGFVIYKRRQG